MATTCAAMNLNPTRLVFNKPVQAPVVLRAGHVDTRTTPLCWSCLQVAVPTGLQHRQRVSARHRATDTARRY